MVKGIQLIQSKKATGHSNSPSVTLDSAPGSGSDRWIVIFVHVDGSTAHTSSYTEVAQGSVGGGQANRGSIWIVQSDGSTTTYTVSSSNSDWTIIACEFSGLANVSAASLIDGTPVGGNTSGTTVETSTVTQGGDNWGRLVLALHGWSGNGTTVSTPPVGYNELSSGETNNSGAWMGWAITGFASADTISSEITLSGSRSQVWVLGCLKGESDNGVIYAQPVDADADDTYLDESNATTNYGSTTEHHLGVLSDKDTTQMNALHKFSISGLGTGKTITEAKLRLYLTTASTPDGASLARCLRTYVETQATWNVYSTGNNWTTGGALGDGSDADWTNNGVLTIANATGVQLLDDDATGGGSLDAIAQAWHDNDSNVGRLVIQPTPLDVNHYCYYYSGEVASKLRVAAPLLYLEYETQVSYDVSVAVLWQDLTATYNASVAVATVNTVSYDTSVMVTSSSPEVTYDTSVAVALTNSEVTYDTSVAVLQAAQEVAYDTSIVVQQQAIEAIYDTSVAVLVTSAVSYDASVAVLTPDSIVSYDASVAVLQQDLTATYDASLAVLQTDTDTSYDASVAVVTDNLTVTYDASVAVQQQAAEASYDTSVLLFGGTSVTYDTSVAVVAENLTVTYDASVAVAVTDQEVTYDTSVAVQAPDQVVTYDTSIVVLVTDSEVTYDASVAILQPNLTVTYDVGVAVLQTDTDTSYDVGVAVQFTDSAAYNVSVYVAEIGLGTEVTYDASVAVLQTDTDTFYDASVAVLEQDLMATHDASVVVQLIDTAAYDASIAVLQQDLTATYDASVAVQATVIAAYDASVAVIGGDQETAYAASVALADVLTAIYDAGVAVQTTGSTGFDVSIAVRGEVTAVYDASVIIGEAVISTGEAAYGASVMAAQYRRIVTFETADRTETVERFDTTETAERLDTTETDEVKLP